MPAPLALPMAPPIGGSTASRSVTIPASRSLQLVARRDLTSSSGVPPGGALEEQFRLTSSCGWITSTSAANDRDLDRRVAASRQLLRPGSLNARMLGRN